MAIIFLLIALSLFMSGMALCAFLWANFYGQFDDLSRPAQEIVLDSEDL